MKEICDRNKLDIHDLDTQGVLILAAGRKIVQRGKSLWYVDENTQTDGLPDIGGMPPEVREAAIEDVMSYTDLDPAGVQATVDAHRESENEKTFRYRLGQNMSGFAGQLLAPTSKR